MPGNVAAAKWLEESSCLSFSWKESVGTEELARLKPGASVDGKELAFENWQLQPGGRRAKARAGGLELEISISSTNSIIAKLRNNSAARCAVDSFALRSVEAEGGILSAPGPRLRVFREGWTMASATGSLRFGESDFKLNPDYKPFAVSTPGEYFDGKPNCFSGEYVSVVNDSGSGLCALFGFISSGEQVTRIAVELASSGASKLAAFSYCDGAELNPGEEISSEEFVAMSGPDGYALLQGFASLWGQRMGALTWSHTPNGWCSWYYYFDKITEKDMLENVAWLKERKAEFPLEYIQMDDGFQAALGDWLECVQEKFPHGLEFLAKEIGKAGFKPGLWLAPFMVEERSKLFKEHPEWMVRNAKGEIVWATAWRGCRVAILDATIPEAEAWLESVFAKLVEWGFEYVKLDFLMYECGVFSLGGVYADKKATRAQALKRGLQAIRRGMGGKFILGCTSPLGPEAGLVNGARIGTDITPYWQKGEGKPFKEAPCVPNVCRNVINRAYMNGRLWINDPDTHIARIDNSELSEDEVLLWTSAIWLTGGLLLLSDRFSTLAPERAKLSKMLLNDMDRFENARPLDFFEMEYPALWLAGEKGKPGSYALGVFNLENSAQSIEVDLRAIDGTGKFSAKELWSGESLGEVAGSFKTALRPHSCKAFLLSASR